jgi:hypothetical protein
MLKTYSKLLQNTTRTISNWKKEGRAIISLLEKYFSKEDLEEFLETGKIQKQELIKDYTREELEKILHNKEKILKILEILN